MTDTSVETSVAIAAQIAHHVGEYEKAWRTHDSVTMREHWLVLEDLCNGKTQESLIRGACAVAAAATRDTDCVTARDRNVDYLRKPSQLQRVILDYLNGDHDITTSELAAVA
jgi:hypothetical protein